MIKIVTSVVTEKLLKEGKIPILHTVETNIPALRACEALGYRLAAREWAYYSFRNSRQRERLLE